MRDASDLHLILVPAALDSRRRGPGALHLSLLLLLCPLDSEGRGALLSACTCLRFFFAFLSLSLSFSPRLSLVHLRGDMYFTW